MIKQIQGGVPFDIAAVMLPIHFLKRNAESSRSGRENRSC